MTSVNTPSSTNNVRLSSALPQVRTCAATRMRRYFSSPYTGSDRPEISASPSTQSSAQHSHNKSSNLAPRSPRRRQLHNAVQCIPLNHTHASTRQSPAPCREQPQQTHDCRFGCKTATNKPINKQTNQQTNKQTNKQMLSRCSGKTPNTYHHQLPLLLLLLLLLLLQ